MSLLDRVATLIRANLNDLVDKAEDPEKLLKQLLLDMQNQFMQLKTQTAIAIADQHLLGSKRTESVTAQAEWMQKAELALAHSDDGLARVALERSLAHQTAALNYAEQLETQASQVTRLRESLSRLQSKMTEARMSADILATRQRRARIALQTGAAQFSDGNHDEALQRLRAKVAASEALGEGYAAMNEPDSRAKLEDYEKNDRIEGLLAELKRKRAGSS